MSRRQCYALNTVKGYNKPNDAIDVFEALREQSCTEGLVSDGQPAQSDVVYELLALITGR